MKNGLKKALEASLLKGTCRCFQRSAVFVVLLSTASQPQAMPVFMGLGDLPGGLNSSEAYGVSADGQTVVGGSRGAAGTEAFRWTPSGGMQGLGYLLDGGLYSHAIGVSADGQTVVGQSGAQAFRWTPDGGMEGIGYLPRRSSSGAYGVSADGQTVVGNSSEAFRWTPVGGMEGLLGGRHGSAYGVSADGQTVVGVSTDDASWEEAFRWTPGGGMEGLGFLPGATTGGVASEAHGVSADGQMVVGFSANDEGAEAFRWTPDGGMEGLGRLVGARASDAVGVSGDGQTIVGYSWYDGYGQRGGKASLWTPDRGTQSLQEILENDYSLNLTGWKLEVATAVSHDGLTIVGTGTNPSGQFEAWLARLGDPLPFVIGDLATMPGQTSFADLTGFKPDLPTIVLTHGWQIPVLTDPYNAAKTPLTELEAAIKARPELKNPDGSYNANILTFQWEAAHNVLPWLPRAAAENAGVELANKLVAMLGTDYNGDIQLIGHSFGTVVNSSAAKALENSFQNKAFGVDQLTFLDAPLFDVATVIGNVVSKGTYYDLLPKGTVQYVDNFYGTTRPIAFGDKLPGAAPDYTSDLSNGGEAVPGYNHSEIQSKFYVERVKDLNGNWVTAALADRYSNRPALQEWPGGESFISKVVAVSTEFAVDKWKSFVNAAEEVKEYVFEVGAKTYHVVLDASKAVIKKSAEIVVTGIEIVGGIITATIDTGSDIVLSTGNQIGSWLHIKESSPVVVGRELTIPAEAETLTFDYDFLNIGDGDWLTVHFDDKLLWTFLGTNFQGGGMPATISIADLAGQNGTLYLTLNSTGDRNADVLIGNIEFTSYLDTLNITRGSVPEPSSIALLIIPFFSLLIMHKRRRASGN